MTTKKPTKKTQEIAQELEQNPQESAPVVEVQEAPEQTQEIPEESVKIDGPFAALSQQAPVQKADEKPKGNGVKIEKDRPEQNGLKRPSAGSTCAIIWDTADEITAKSGHTCTSAELFNALQGYNECTLRTQYARWRQFNGITGRLPNQQKTVKLPAEWQDAMDILRVRIADDKVDAIKALEACKSPADLVAWIAHNSENF